MRTFAALVLFPLLLLACDSDSPTSTQDVLLSFETVLKEPYSGLHFPLQAVIREPSQWEMVWQMIHTAGGGVPIPIPPAVDFGREMVVVAAIGQRSDGCYAVDLTSATLRGSGRLDLEITETVPGPGCVCTTALTQPVHVVTLARTYGPDRFIERRQERRC